MKNKSSGSMWVVIGTIFVIGLSIYMEASAWTECRQTNSFWYCMRVLNK